MLLALQRAGLPPSRVYFQPHITPSGNRDEVVVTTARLRSAIPLLAVLDQVRIRVFI